MYKHTSGVSTKPRSWRLLRPHGASSLDLEGIVGFDSVWVEVKYPLVDLCIEGLVGQKVWRSAYPIRP